ncbi:MAG: HAD hydrolase family protein [Lachnospiraceae bacterium]|nr:HAD hydrolase family protein [Lachnospiraceae bacterium]
MFNNWNDIKLIISDFDGVMTDNRILVDDQGNESAYVSRADGQAIHILSTMGIELLIMSTEVNGIVEKRARKLNVECLHGVSDKAECLKKYCGDRNIELKNVAYVGNDVNDYEAMKLVGLKIVPNDAYDVVKKIADYVTKTKGGYGVIREIAEVIQTKRADKISPMLQSNIQYKDIHMGERVFILCSGPSISELDLTLLKNEKTIAVNSFYLHKDCQIISPTYYCEPAFEEYSSFETVAQHLREMEQATPEAHYFFGIKEKENVEKVNEFEGRCVNYMAFTNEYDRSDIDLTRCVMGVQSVSIMALEIAIYMGFTEIYLLGTEHDSLLTGKYTHFYEYQESIAANEDKMLDEQGNIRYTFDEELSAIYNLWEQYKIIRKIAKKKRIKIYNATPAGVLDLFEKKEFYMLF